MSFSRRKFLLVGAAAVGSAAALAAACTPAAPPPLATVAPTAATPTVAPTVAPAGGPTVAPAVAPSPTSAAAAALKIGLLLPYNESSIGVDIGLNQKRAADLYLKRQGGKLGGRPVSLVYSSESVETAINKVKLKTLLETEKVDLLMGAAANDAAYATRDASEAAKMVYMATNATANALTRAVRDCGPTCQSKYLFRTSATAWQLSQPLGQWAAKHGMTDFYVCCVDETFGTESADAFEAGLATTGGQSTERKVVPSGGDWTPIVSAISGQPTKNVFAAFHTDDAEGFVSEWDKQGLRAAGFKLFGPGQLADQEVLSQTKSAAEGIITSHFWSTELKTAENKMLVDLFPQEYKDDDTGAPIILSGYAVQMWDAMTALDSALKTINGDAHNADGLIGALEQVSFNSPRGTFVFDRATHNPVQDIHIREVTMSNGTLVNAVRDTFAAVADPGA